MSPIEYLISAVSYWPQYLLIFVFVSIFYYSLSRRLTFGLFDPLFFVLFGDVFGWALVTTMFIRGDVSPYYFASFISTQIFYILGATLACMLWPRTPIAEVSTNDRGVALAMFAVAWAAHVVFNLTIWSIAGIPIFRASQIGAFYGSGGLGIVERLAGSSGEIAVFSALYLYFHTRVRIARSMLLAFLLWYLLFLTLSGGKSALLSLGEFVFLGYLIFGRPADPRQMFFGGRVGLLFFLIASIFALAVLAFKGSAGIALAGVGLGFRLISYADIYIYAYPGGLIEHVSASNPFFGLFGGLLSTFRLIPADIVDENLGLRLFRIVFPDVSYIAGPNPRQAVFAYHYFGVFAFVFSFVIGYLTLLAQRHLILGRNGRRFLGTLIAFELYIAAVSMSTDFSSAMSKLATAAMGLFCIALFALPICYACERRRFSVG